MELCYMSIIFLDSFGINVYYTVFNPKTSKMYLALI